MCHKSICNIVQICSNNGCYCHQNCHTLNNRSSDISDIYCHPASSFSPTVSPTPTFTPGMIKKALAIH